MLKMALILEWGFSFYRLPAGQHRFEHLVFIFIYSLFLWAWLVPLHLAPGSSLRPQKCCGFEALQGWGRNGRTAPGYNARIAPGLQGLLPGSDFCPLSWHKALKTCGPIMVWLVIYFSSSPPNLVWFSSDIKGEVDRCSNMDRNSIKWCQSGKYMTALLLLSLSGALFKAEITTAWHSVFMAVFSFNWVHYVHFLCSFSNLIRRLIYCLPGFSQLSPSIDIFPLLPSFPLLCVSPLFLRLIFAVKVSVSVWE